MIELRWLCLEALVEHEDEEQLQGEEAGEPWSEGQERLQLGEEEEEGKDQQPEEEDNPLLSFYSSRKSFHSSTALAHSPCPETSSSRCT